MDQSQILDKSNSRDWKKTTELVSLIRKKILLQKGSRMGNILG